MSILMVLDAGFLVLVPKALMVIAIVLMIGCPISALLFPDRKEDPIFRHDCM